MERRRRMEPSRPAFSTPITLHNYWPGPRTSQRPRCLRTALEPIETGTGWAGTARQERQPSREWSRARGPPSVIAQDDGRVMESLSGA